MIHGLLLDVNESHTKLGKNTSDILRARSLHDPLPILFGHDCININKVRKKVQ